MKAKTSVRKREGREREMGGVKRGQTEFGLP